MIMHDRHILYHKFLAFISCFYENSHYNGGTVCRHGHIEGSRDIVIHVLLVLLLIVIVTVLTVVSRTWSPSSASESASGDDLCSQGRPWLRRYGRHQLRHRCCHSFRPSGPRLLGKERLLESRTEQHNVQLRSKVDLMSRPTKWSRRRL